MSDPVLLVLASLAEGDKHGYAMMEDIDTFAGIRLGPGTLYGAITRLEQRGWIKPVASKDDRRQPYRITGAGREHLTEQLSALSKVVKTGQRRLNESEAFSTLQVAIAHMAHARRRAMLAIMPTRFQASSTRERRQYCQRCTPSACATGAL